MRGERLVVGHSESQECRVFAAWAGVGEGEGGRGRGSKKEISNNFMNFN